MTDRDTTAVLEADATLVDELAALRARLDEAEQTLEAIRNGEVDAVVVGGPAGQLVYTLENADRPYRVLVEQMQEGAITLAEDGTVLYCNLRFSTIVGRPHQQILGQSVTTFFTADEGESFLATLRTQPLVTAVGEFSLHGADGLGVPVNISLVDLHVDEHMPRIICGVVTDLTHNRRRTEELARANARLAGEVDERSRVEDSLRLALEAADMGNWEIDLANGQARHSLRHDQIFGHAEPVSRWDLSTALEYFLPEDRPVVARAFAEAERTGSVAFERRIRRAGDNAVRWLAVRGRVYYEAGRAVRIAGVVSDVTDQRVVEEQLRQAQKMEAVGQLTGGIAHDFNNLLLVIGGSLEMLGRRVPDDERSRRLLDAAKAGVARGAKLNHQLLAFSRRQDLQAEVLSIDELVKTFEHLLGRAVGETVKIRIESTPDLWLCRTDPHQLETAILNLAINARDAMPDGGTLTIATANRVVASTTALGSGVEPGEYVVIAVSDSGTGMTAEVIARAFEPFFTTKEIGKGTGLGLSQVYGFAKQSDGFVGIESELDRGTTILIHLPRTHHDRTDAGGGEAEVHPMIVGRETILLVEDDVDVRAIAAAMLRDLGYAVRETGSARSALALLDSGESVDLVFSDVIMPNGMSGIDLARELGKRPVQPRVLLTSGYTAQRLIPENLLSELRLLRKPYTQPELSRAIEEALRAHAS